nr:MAG TPA: hypothetical protein [Caudoviricetes sp.]
MKENSIGEDIKIIEDFILKTDVDYSEYNEQIVGDISYQAIQHILSDYKRVLKENEELQEEFKQIDHECERLEEKEVRLIKENEYYKDLIYALETYYNITREDLEKCMKNDR